MLATNCVSSKIFLPELGNRNLSIKEIDILKVLTSEDKIAVKSKYSTRSEEFYNNSSAILATTNNVKIFTNLEMGIQEHIMILSTQNSIPENELETLLSYKKGELKGKLVPELPRILSWILEISLPEARESLKTRITEKFDTNQAENLLMTFIKTLNKDYNGYLSMGNDCLKKYYFDYCFEKNVKRVSKRKFKNFLLEILKKNNFYVEIKRKKDGFKFAVYSPNKQKLCIGSYNKTLKVK